MALWSTTKVLRAKAELTGVTEVQGIQRSFHAPHGHALGWVIDPRSGDLALELLRRYGPDHPQLEPTAWDREGLSSALDAAGYVHESGAPKTWDGLSPRLRGTRQGVHLLLRKFGIQWVVFYPEVGVVLTDTLPPAEWEITLLETREAPW